MLYSSMKFILVDMFNMSRVLCLPFALILGLAREGDWTRVRSWFQLHRIRTATWNMMYCIAANQLLLSDHLRRPRERSGVNERDRSDSSDEECSIFHDVEFEVRLKLQFESGGLFEK